MARFLLGLNREIQDRVEMQHYVELEVWCTWPSKWSNNSRGGWITLIRIPPKRMRLNTRRNPRKFYDQIRSEDLDPLFTTSKKLGI